MQVGATELFIGKVQVRRGYDSVHHFALVLIVVAVVGALVTAKCQHQGALTAAPCASCPLNIIRRAGRNITQVHGIQFANIYTKFHSRGAKQRGEPLRFRNFLIMPESCFIILSFFIVELSRMLSGEAVFELIERRSIKFLKKEVGLQGFVFPQAQAKPVVINGISAAGHPADAVNRQLV